MGVDVARLSEAQPDRLVQQEKVSWSGLETAVDLAYK